MKYKCPVCGKEEEYSAGYSPLCSCSATMIAVPTATFCGPAYPPDAEHMAKYLESGEYDDQVVERFNELVKEKKIESPMMGAGWIIFNDRVRLRPTPRYRAFTAVEAAAQLGRPVSFDPGANCDHRYVACRRWSVSATHIYFDHEDNCSFADAVDKVKFTDNGEPFGVEEK